MAASAVIYFLGKDGGTYEQRATLSHVAVGGPAAAQTEESAGIELSPMNPVGEHCVLHSVAIAIVHCRPV